jgi:ribosomal protein S18 acetylase RimI-like enzyme
MNYSWRTPHESDLPALAALDAVCLATDGPASVTWNTYTQLLDMPGVAMLCAAPEGAEEQIVAVGWALERDDRAWLQGKVHPEHRRRGLGTHLLRWTEEQASALGNPERLVIRNEALNEGSAALYAKEGYRCNFIENWMQRDLSEPLPTISQTFQHITWSPENASRFYEAYIEAFRERIRPGSNVESADEWTREYSEDHDFRPDLSLLALDGDRAVGFVMSGTNSIAGLGKRIGWISQVGSHPAYRGRGVAAGLIASLMEALKREDLDALGLHVNVDNPGAIRVYEQLGFRLMGQRAVYSKPRP